MSNTFPAQRRGIAMLLILISLAMATLLTTAYLSSRDNSAAIGENIASATSARWAAVSGLELGVATLQTETAWRTGHVNGKLLDDYMLDGAMVDLDVLDVETGLPPTATTRHVRLTCTATVNGVEQLATAVADVAPSAEGGTVTVDLSEFAVFAADKILLENEATITRWPKAPLSELGKRLAMGTHSVNASAVEIKGNAASIDTTVYSPPSASSSLVLNGSGLAIEEVELADTVPMPEPPDPGVPIPHPTDGYPVLNRDGGIATLSADYRLGGMYIWNNSQFNITGDVTLTINHDLHIRSDATIVVDGHAKLIVFGDMLMEDASIQILPDATLELYVRGNADLKDAYIGDGPYVESTDRDPSGNARWMDPSRVVIYSVEPYDFADWVWTGYDWEWVEESVSADQWRLYSHTVIKGSVYVPHLRELKLEQDSVIYGRVAGNVAWLKDRGAIFYDHILDSGYGYTNPFSPLFNEDGTILDPFKALSSLNDGDLQVLADATGIPIRLGDAEFGTAGGEPVPEPEPGEPTPRTVTVDYQYIAFGSQIEYWEKAAAANAAIAAAE